MKHQIAFTLNGEMRQIDVETNDTLLEVLREKMGIKSPKIGCNRGDCGTCTVFLNGKSVRSCLILAVEVEGQEVTTIEGIQKEKLTPLQRNFINHNSFQCGYCAPGIVITATELLQKHPKPTDEVIKEILAGNLCRCTGYEAIIAAIRATAKETNGGH